MWKDVAKEMLEKHFQLMKKKNPAFSRRAFAKKMKISSGALTEILNGRRAVSRRTLLKMLEHLPLEPREAEKLNAYLEGNVQGYRRVLKEDVFQKIQDWRFFAFLAATELSSPPRTVDDFVAAFRMPVEKVNETLQVLLELNFLKVSSRGIYSNTGEHLESTNDVPSDAVRRWHLSGLERAKEALMTMSVDERDFYALTFPGTSEGLKKVKKEIRRFAHRTQTLMSGAQKDRVYKVSIQLHPLTFGGAEK